MLTSCGFPGRVLHLGTEYVVGLGGACNPIQEWSSLGEYEAEDIDLLQQLSLAGLTACSSSSPTIEVSSETVTEIAETTSGTETISSTETITRSVELSTSTSIRASKTAAVAATETAVHRASETGATIVTTSTTSTATATDTIDGISSMQGRIAATEIPPLEQIDAPAAGIALSLSSLLVLAMALLAATVVATWIPH